MVEKTIADDDVAVEEEAAYATSQAARDRPYPPDGPFQNWIAKVPFSDFIPAE